MFQDIFEQHQNIAQTAILSRYYEEPQLTRLRTQPSEYFGQPLSTTIRSVTGTTRRCVTLWTRLALRRRGRGACLMWSRRALALAVTTRSSCLTVPTISSHFLHLPHFFQQIVSEGLSPAGVGMIRPSTIAHANAASTIESG